MNPTPAPQPATAALAGRDEHFYEELSRTNNELMNLHREMARVNGELARSLSLLHATLESTADGIVAVDLAGKVISYNTKFTGLWRFPAGMLERGDAREMRLYTAQLVNDPETFLRRMKELEVIPEAEALTVIELKDGRTFERHVFPQRVDKKRVGVVIHWRDITERKGIGEALQRQQTELRALFDLIPAMIWFKDTKNGILRVNKLVATAAGKSIEEIEGRPSREIYPDEADRFYKEDLEVIRSKEPKLGIVETLRDKDGREIWMRTSKVPYCNKEGEVIGIVVMAEDTTNQKRAAAELEHTHRQLLDISRQAGMAEIATNVLHNVGNVLNSVNISTGLLVESVMKSRASSLARVVVLLQEHAHDLGEFITTDPRGKHVPAHLAQLSEYLIADQAGIVSELNSLRQNVEHIKEIVAMQQNYAVVGGVKEVINVIQLVEDSMRINEGALNRHRVEVVREFSKVPTMNVEKHKILQILVNLVRNAKHACQESDRADKRMTVRVTNGSGWVKISVMDNGVGIPPENLTRIFNFGFTTRKDGHGFGLHSGALAAKEMGGTLTVHSDGPGQGAAFTLELPCPPPEKSHE